MKKAYADIRWISYSEGGRKTLPQPGAMYYPHISIDRKAENNAWSICFPVTPIGSDGSSAICFSMLVDNTATQAFFSKLSVGMDFTLLEGKTAVAVGKINRIEE